MEKRLQQALDYSNFRLILAARQENLKTLLNNRLMLTYEGGLFKVDMTLISFISSLVRVNADTIIIVDIHDIPIEIYDLPGFLETLLQKYKTATEHYLNSYQKLEEVRSIRKAVDWEDENE